jgi:trypsin
MKLLIVLALFGAASATPFFRGNIHRGVTRLIVGGVEAQKGDFPFLIEIKHVLSSSPWKHFCGASLVNPNWIVTAAHCMVYDIDGYTIVAGQHRLNETESTEQERSVAQIVIHPSYSGAPQYYNDIAVVRVNSPFTLNQWVQSANLAAPDYRPGGDVDVAGWGDLEFWGESPTVLMRVAVPMTTDEYCRQAYGAGFAAGMICAGEEGKDSCQGDSGGPLVKGDILSGIVSKGNGCAWAGYPGVYTEIAYFNTWIQQNT